MIAAQLPCPNKTGAGYSGNGSQWVLTAGRGRAGRKILARGAGLVRIGTDSAATGRMTDFCGFQRVRWGLVGLIELVRLCRVTDFCGFWAACPLIGKLSRVCSGGADRRGGATPFGPRVANSTPVAADGLEIAKNSFPGPYGPISGDVSPSSHWQLVPAFAVRREIQWCQMGSGVWAARAWSVKRRALRRPQQLFCGFRVRVADFIAGMQRGWSCLLSVKLGGTLCRVSAHVN